MHVGAGAGHVYRAHERRDWPTGQAYPILWPYRILLGTMYIDNWPDPLLEGLSGRQSSFGQVAADGHTLTYLFENTLLTEIASLQFSYTPFGSDRNQTFFWLFSENHYPGFLLFTARGYLLDEGTDRWKMTRPIALSKITRTATGAFVGTNVNIAGLLIEMFPVIWSDLPPGEQNP